MAQLARIPSIAGVCFQRIKITDSRDTQKMAKSSGCSCQGRCSRCAMRRHVTAKPGQRAGDAPQCSFCGRHKKSWFHCAFRHKTRRPRWNSTTTVTASKTQQLFQQPQGLFTPVFYSLDPRPSFFISPQRPRLTEAQPRQDVVDELSILRGEVSRGG